TTVITCTQCETTPRVRYACILLTSMSSHAMTNVSYISFIFFNNTATTEIYTLSLHDALPISALASIKLIQASAVLDLTEDDFDFLTSNKVWIATDRSRARRCVEACVYGTLDFVGYPRFPAPVEFIAAVIAYYVHPVNI